MPKTRIAILGGGAGSLSAAYQLTRTPELRAKHDVTIYQMGWRLGGQGASGRNRDEHDRVEEHGLHIWLGFYENAFAMMRECYAEQAKEPDNPFQAWTDAFKPESITPLGLGDGQTYFLAEWPTNADTPGDGQLLLTPWGAVTEALGVLAEIVKQLLADIEHEIGRGHMVRAALAIVGRLLASIVSDLRTRKGLGHAIRKTIAVAGAIPGLALRHSSGRLHHLLERSHLTSVSAESMEGAFDHALAEATLLLLEGAHDVVRRLVDPTGEGALLGMILDTATATLRGLLNPRYGFTTTWDLNGLDEYEYLDWLIENGARPTIKSVPRLFDAPELRALYDLAFAYRTDLAKGLQPDFAAGAAIRSLIRIFATYKGAVLYEMQAGMGETVIGPLYQVLKARGVHFEFFHKVRHLELSPNKRWIQRVHLDRQVDLAGASYDPMFTVKGLPCWPSEPFWEQIRNGPAIKAQLDAAGLTLESRWCDTKAGDVSLELGTDFDKVILGINLGAFQKLNDEDPSMCEELIAASPQFRAMTEQLGLIPTFGVQLWMDRDLQGLGWAHPKPAMDGSAEPMDVWADMSQVLDKESWPLAAGPRSIQYFCGPFNTDLFRRPSRDHDVPRLATEAVADIARTWLSTYTATIWPSALEPGTQATLDWALLHTAANAQGPARVATQWMRANVDPSECCVASWHGSTKYRLRQGDSGFLNLYLAGTWTRTGMNVTCVEGAVMSGAAASRAICGEPATIVGFNFLQSP